MANYKELFEELQEQVDEVKMILSMDYTDKEKVAYIIEELRRKK